VRVFAFFDSRIGIPAVVFYFAKELIVLHHARAARFVMVEVNEATIAKFFAPSWKMLGNNVGMNVNLHLRQI
jgi:hypothetical protein